MLKLNSHRRDTKKLPQAWSQEMGMKRNGFLLSTNCEGWVWSCAHEGHLHEGKVGSKVM
jgi:hypothetical protein